MNERQMVSRLSKYVKEHNPEVFWHVLADLPTAGHQQPFDVFALAYGNAFAFEFKKGIDWKLRPHQKEALDAFHKSGGFAYVGAFNEAGTECKFFKYPFINTLTCGIRCVYYKDGQWIGMLSIFDEAVRYA